MSEKSYTCSECGAHYLAGKLNCDCTCWNYRGLQEDYNRLQEEVEKLKEALGAACVAALQEDYQPIDELARTVRIDFTDGSPTASLPNKERTEG